MISRIHKVAVMDILKLQSFHWKVENSQEKFRDCDAPL